MNNPVAVVGFNTAGCIPFHLKALLASGHPFAFFGSKKLYELATLEWPNVGHVQTYFSEGTRNSTEEFLWLEKTVSLHPEIETVYFMEVERFRKEIIQAKWTKKFPVLGKRRLRGNLFPRPCFYNRHTFRDKLAFFKWQIWGFFARFSIERHGLLVIDSHYKKLFPILRAIPNGMKLLRESPEPYDRVLVPDKVSRACDSNPPSILFFGHHTKRKGTCWALRALEAFSTPLRVIIAGQSDDEPLVRQLCEALPPHITPELLLQRISDETKEVLFKRASIIMLPYEVFLGSSGLVFEAMIYGRKVLASDICAVDERLLKSNAVNLYRVGDDKDFLRQLSNCLGSVPDFQGVETFLSEHGIEKFAQAVLPTQN